MNLTTLTEEEARELLDTMRFLRKRSDEYFADFKMDEIPKRQKANLPDVLDWWSERTTRTKSSQYVVPLLVTAISPIIGGIIVAAIIKIFGL